MSLKFGPGPWSQPRLIAALLFRWKLGLRTRLTAAGCLATCHGVSDRNGFESWPHKLFFWEKICQTLKVIYQTLHGKGHLQQCVEGRHVWNTTTVIWTLTCLSFNGQICWPLSFWTFRPLKKRKLFKICMTNKWWHTVLIFENNSFVFLNNMIIKYYNFKIIICKNKFNFNIINECK